MAKKIRDIIEIDEERCNGCGQCVIDCAEGAIALVDGKAKVIADIYCDGLGACLGGCPVDALRIIRREADDFDEEAVQDHLLRQGKPAPMAAQAGPGAHGACNCPGAAATSFTLLPMRDGPGSADLDACEGIPGPGAAGGPGARRWPLKIRLMPEEAPFLRGAALLVAADCAAFAAPDFHQRLADGKVMLIGCPKFEGSEALARKLEAIVRAAKPESLLVARMEVPCCRALTKACLDALGAAGEDIPQREAVISRAGEVTGS
ncbi:MAG: ferredoxin [Desulfovibrionaceae bacterium]|nr:ferredoxin [Desulfovibrionaceae bacterium]